ncbi:MAG TPA: asparagine synthase (glutamine-hydrolyzing), partial [Armatimonadota bacterium]|nr:asparagine synthase (glutamine-hydrolyzing) [Armatimonadota bacterium]
MCGVVAILSQSAPVGEETLQRALEALRHRGPDGSGVWGTPDRRVALGHARLSVIDLETGAQPLSSEDGQVVAVVNGEFYDWERIRRILEQRGHRFSTHSDSEILVHLYEQYGQDCLRHLRGEFAFVLWDGRRRQLFAARDRWGIKPLCYVMVDGTLYLASEAKGLFAAGVRAAWDREAFFQAAHLQYVPPDRTLFAGVCQLRPGHSLIAADGEVRTHGYWYLDYPPVEHAAMDASEADIVHELRELLDEAVRLRLRADVPVACHLSGGLDSSAVLGLAARHSPRPIDCFTVSFDAAPYDELRVAEEMARHAGANLHPVRVTQDDLVEHLSDAVYFSEGLAINGHLTAKFLL